MKKLILLTALLSIASLNSFSAVKGSVTTGFEARDYNSTYDDNASSGSKNYIEPYISGVVNPVENSPLKLVLTYKYRQHDGQGASSVRRNDRRDTVEGYINYPLKFDNFVLSPQFGIVSETYDTHTDGKTHNLTQYRIYPNMNYNLNSKLTLLIVNGYFAPVTKEVEGGEEKGGNYKYELSTGLSYKVSGSGSLQGVLFFAGDKYKQSANSYYSGNKYNEKGETSTRNTELRVQYTHSLMDKKLSLKPYVRIPLDREKKANVGLYDSNGVSKAYSYDEPETRIGFATTYKIAPDFSVFADIWYDHLKAEYDNDKAREQNKGLREKPSEHYWALKTGFTKSF